MDKYNITRQDSVFVLIDFQENLAAAMEQKVLANVERNVGLMVSSCRELSVPILVTEQYRKGLGPTVERIRNRLAGDYRPVDKMEFNSCTNGQFRDLFKEAAKKYVIVAGIEAHVCVLQSVLDFIANGYFAHVLSDAVCSRYKNDWQAAMDYLRDAGAIITTTEIVTFQLLGKACTSEFKAVSPLFKNKQAYWSL